MPNDRVPPLTASHATLRELKTSINRQGIRDTNLGLMTSVFQDRERDYLWLDGGGVDELVRYFDMNGIRDS
jgi:hypothetical protein